MWIKARQFTGRIVTVTNDKIFETAVYNYSRDFPFIWEEMNIPLKYDVDRVLAENIITKVVQKYTEEPLKKASPLLENIAIKYGIQGDDILPKVYYRLTSDWLELTVRFIIDVHGIRDTKDQICRDLLDKFDEHNIEIASTTFEIVGLPTLAFDKMPPRNNPLQREFHEQ